MKRFLLSLVCGFALLTPGLHLSAQSSTPPPAAAAEHANTTAAAAAVATGKVQPKTPDFLEHLVDAILDAFNVSRADNENTTAHYVIAALILVAAFILRRVVTTIIFNQLKKLAARTTTTLDDKLFPALETPTATFVMAVGIFSSLKVLKLSPTADETLATASTIVFSLIIFWAVFKAFNAVLDHAAEIAQQKQMGVAAFMPWIKKTLITIFAILGVLMVIQSLGYDVRALLTGLGIGGLAFALAAQDTIANLFGSVVVAIDQPFKIGEAVKIGSNEGVVEDIGLRSTKLRPPGKNLIIIPNKTVAAEAIINNSRFIARRVEQVIGLTYDATPDQLDAIVAEIKALILKEEEVAPKSVMVFFRDFNASSLDIWLAYETKGPDFQAQMRLRQRINLAIMRLVAERKLSFAYPTSVMHLDGPIAQQLVSQRTDAPGQPPGPRV
jgi:MscS family membrane protein